MTNAPCSSIPTTNGPVSDRCRTAAPWLLEHVVMTHVVYFPRLCPENVVQLENALSVDTKVEMKKKPFSYGEDVSSGLAT